MNVDYEALSELFRVQDIEGLIAIGAPEDEYEPEVERIFEKVSALPKDQASTETLIEIFNGVYLQMFGCSDKEIQRRQADFCDIAENIMRFWG